MTTLLWILVVAGGPILLGGAIAYAMLNRRRLTPGEEDRRNAAIRDMYASPDEK